jgi:phosphatidylglycerol:prolipoprotein diacylglycerol transferase
MFQVLFWIPTPFGTFPVFGFGLMLFFAFIGTTWLVGRLGQREGIPKEKMQDLALWVFVGGLVVARITFLLTPEAGVRSLTDFFNRFVRIWEGGIVFYGSFLGGVLAFTAFWYAAFRPFGVRYWQLADAVAPCVALGLFFGRLGCFLNGCCYGHVACTECAVAPAYFPSMTAPATGTLLNQGAQTLAGFAMDPAAADDRTVGAVEPDSAAAGAGLRRGDVITAIDGKPVKDYFELVAALSPDRGWPRGQTLLRLTVTRDGADADVSYVPRLIGLYPTQLYEATTAFLLLLLLLAFYPFRRHHGQVFVLLLVCYAVHRFLNEQLRNDTQPVAFGLTLSQNVSVLVLIVAPILELYLRATQPRLLRGGLAGPGGPAAAPVA